MTKKELCICMADMEQGVLPVCFCHASRPPMSLCYSEEMMHSQEPRVSSSQDSLCLNVNSSVSALVKRLDSCTATPSPPKGASSSNEEEKKVLAILPWLPRFSMLSRFSLGSRNIKPLKRLMSTYLRDISEMVKKSLKKTVRASKLKKNMSEVLVMFHMMYIDIREPFEQESYLDLMSDLVAMYLDMEIRASKGMKESLPNVVSRLTMYLNILLGNSEAHILDTILKARLFNKNHEKICAPVIGKVVGSAKSSTVQTMLYVRYLLVYKLWKKVVSSGVERIHINKLAVQRLVAPSNLLDKSSAIFVSILPKKPKTKKNTTLFFMQAKFDLKKSVQGLMKLLKESQLSDFPAVAIKKPAPFSCPSFLDTESNLVFGDDSISPFNDVWSSISSIDINFSEVAQESPVITVKKDREADVTSTQKSPKIKKYKKAKGKIKVLSDLIDKKKRKKNKPKSVKACRSVSLSCIKPNVICCKTGKKSDNLFQKENSTLSVADLASNLRALSTVDSSITPDSVSASSSLSPREVHSLQYENLSSTTSMESPPAGIPTPPASLPPPVAEQMPRTLTQAPVPGMTTSLEALLEGLPRKQEQPDSDDGDREMAEMKCDVRVLENAPDSSDKMEVGEMDSKLNILSSGRLNPETVEGGENSGCVVGFGVNIKGDLDERENRPLSRGSSVIQLGSEVDADENLATVCMDVDLEEEHCMVEGTLGSQSERTGEHQGVERVQDKFVGSGVCVIQKVSDIIKVNSSTCVVDNEHPPIQNLAGHKAASISPYMVGNASFNGVNSVVEVPFNNSFSAELAGGIKSDMVFADSLFHDPPAAANNSIDIIAATEDSSSRESVTIIEATDTVATNGDIDVGVVIPTSTVLNSEGLGGSRNVQRLQDSGNDTLHSENSVKISTLTFDNVIVPCTGSNVAMLPSDDLPVVDDDQSSDDVQIICERVTAPGRLSVKNESRTRDDFTRLQKDFFNSTEYDSDVEIFEGLAKDTREDLTSSSERATIARVEHRNELVVEQVLSGQFPVTLDLDNSHATLAVDLNFCSAPPDSPPINGGTLQFNEISPINNKTAGIEFGLYEKTSDKIQPGSTDPWLTDGANSFSFNFSRFSPVQETAPMNFLDDDDADLSDDACSAYSAHVPRFSEGGKRRSEEFRTKIHKEGSENLPESRKCNGLQSSAVIEESRTIPTPRPVSPVQQKESEQSVPLCNRKPTSEKLSVRIPQVNTVRHFTSSLPCDQQEDRSDGEGDSVVEPPCKVIRTPKSSLPNEEADYFRQVSSVHLEHLSQETVAAQQPPEREASPAAKALEEPKQLNKQAPKASPRGMCLDGDNNKLDIHIGNYADVHPIPSYHPMPGAPLGCHCSPFFFCSLCFYGVMGSNPYQRHYLQPYNKEVQETESENQVLLKEIEKTLNKSEHAKLDKVNKDEQDTQYSAGKESSLPLKKRLKIIPPDPVNSVSVPQRDSPCENLPSYQSRRMMSIAELEVHNRSLMKQWEGTVEVRESSAYHSRYSNDGYYANYQMPVKDVYAPQEEIVQEKSYPHESLNNTKDYNYEKSPEVGYKESLHYNNSVPVNYQHNKDANMNCVKMKVPFVSSDDCRIQFKTPAELKEVPSMSDSLKELTAMTYQPGLQSSADQSSADGGQYPDSVPNRLSSVYYPIANKESRQVLDLSVVKDVQCLKNGHKRKQNIASEYNVKYSRKRCKADNVQATEIIDGFRVPYEKKRRRKSTR